MRASNLGLSIFIPMQTTKKTRKKLKLPRLMQPSNALSPAELPAPAAEPPSTGTHAHVSEPRAHRIIIEDFVELTPANTITPKVI